MGNTTALPYDVLESVPYTNNNSWSLNNGCKQQLEAQLPRQNVSIFKFPKAQRPDKLSLAQRHVQKLRTIKYPYILSYIDSIEMDDSLLLVTEPCVPLEVWCSKILQDSSIPQQNIIYELHWGFKCILQALDFLHSTCSSLHGNLGLHSIFVTPNGDWKLSSLELLSNFNHEDDINFFLNNHFILDKHFISPERATLTDRDSAKIEAILKAKLPPYYIDIYSLGQCVQRCFVLVKEELSGSFAKHIDLTVSSEMKKRPTAKKLLQTATFNSDYIKILENVQEFSLKGPKEILESIKQLDPLLPQMPVAICSHKVLPNVCRVLTICINDFQNRDARESCRQAIVVCIDLLSKLGELKKIDPQAFQTDCAGVVAQLWTMTDRTIRTSMLAVLKSIAELLPRDMVNKSIFDNIIAGFSDSNAKLRESTLMSLLYIIDKLDELQLQDRLVRCLGNLQNDPEASIRTNTIIFFGKIAAKLKEAVRQKVLCNALVKAMKDNFVHCRIASLKTATACLKFIDPVQLASKLLPQVSVLLLDRSNDIRSLSLTLMDASVVRMRQYHEELVESSRQQRHEEHDRAEAPSEATAGTSAGASSWSTWSGTMLQGLAKTADTPTATPGKTTGGTVEGQSSTASAHGTPIRPVTLPNGVTSASAAHKPMVEPVNNRAPKSNYLDDFDDDDGEINKPRGKPQSSTSKPSASAWDDDLDGLDNDMDNVNVASTSSSAFQQGGGSMSGRWGDDDLDSALLDDHQPATPKSQSVALTPSTSFNTLSTSSAHGVDLPTTSTTSKLKAKPVKVAVKKLEVANDDWEDF